MHFLPDATVADALVEDVDDVMLLEVVIDDVRVIEVVADEARLDEVVVDNVKLVDGVVEDVRLVEVEAEVEESELVVIERVSAPAIFASCRAASNSTTVLNRRITMMVIQLL
jgi:hypothetical protein